MARRRHHATTKRLALDERAETPPKAPEACIVVVQGKQLGHRIEVGENAITIGRAPECELCLPDHSVSRRHCRVEMFSGHYEISDLGSTNQTFVNGVAVDRAALNDGDRIEVGRNVLKFFGKESGEADYHSVLLELALRDSLTGLLVRRRFRELLDSTLATASRPLDVGLMILDLDHFKPVNDRLGHLAGDQVLRVCSAVLRAGVPEQAIVGRLGGEEFSVLLPKTTSKELVSLAEALREEQARQAVRIEEEVVQVTVSIGCAMWQPSMQDAGTLLRCADKALYQAKETGRNRVVMFKV